MAYRLGYCPQCNEQIMIQDLNGRWCGRTPHFREADLIFDDGHRVRTILCAGCLKNIDFEKLMASIREEGSQISDIQREAISQGNPILIVNRTL